MNEHCPGDAPADEAFSQRTDRFIIASVNGKIGKGVQTRARIERGSLVARFSGTLSNTVLQHTLQVTEHTHLHDPTFVGLLSHSCAPNCVLDMQRLEIWALADIGAGELLTIDYAVTEDVLFRQFPCNCGSSGCRKWITGRRERVNEAGRTYLSELAAGKVPSLLPKARRQAR